jgi:PAP2 superfamily
MKTFRTLTWPSSLAAALLMLSSLLSIGSCSNDDDSPDPAVSASPAASTYRADVALSWLNIELRLVRTTPVVSALTFGRPFAYAGVAGYEAAVPGMAGYRSLAGQLNGLSGLPTVDPAQSYNWALSANAALAAINRSLFANATPAGFATIDSLEAANLAAFKGSLGDEANRRSVEFGKQVAAAVFAWSKTDGNDNAAPYTPPTGPGLWAPTPPQLSPAVFPHWGANRPLVAGSGDGADPGPPMSYNAAPGSPFYNMATEVLTVSQTRTPEQTAIALFWNDVPNGRSFTPPGHWVSILAQVLARDNATLDKALFASAKLGVCLNDALISSMKTKFVYNVLRPVTYIRATLGQPTWLPLIPTPAFPEYSANHATLSAAAAEALTEVFGPTYAFTDQSYVSFGMAARSYPSFEQAAAEAGMSRLYGGIHYRPSVEKGLVQGKKVAQNIDAKLRFK